ncbi:MAG: hypothetical protein ABSH23_09575 [Steroidobacteraceae bacterium]
MRVSRRPSLCVLLLSAMLASGFGTLAQAGLANLFHGTGTHSKQPVKALHSSTAQPPVHLIHGARQGKIKPVLGNTRTAARTLTLKRSKPH